jgi:hypothetical protein
MAKSKFAGLKPDLGLEQGEPQENQAIEKVADAPEVAESSESAAKPKAVRTTRKPARNTPKPGTNNQPSSPAAKPTAAPKATQLEPVTTPRKVTRRGNPDYIAVTRYLDRQIMLRLNGVEDRLRLSRTWILINRN